jgi:glycosyltransferase 2 family protein
MGQTNHKVLITVSLIVIGIMVLALVTAVYSDVPKLLDIFHHIKIESLLFALLCTGLAYLAFTLSFNALFEMTPYRIPFDRFFSIMFISYTINFVVSSGGVSSLALRSFLMKQEKVPYSVTIPLSFAQNMIFNLVLCCVCFFGLGYLHGNPQFMGGTGQFFIFFFMGGLIFLVAVMVLTFISRAFRKWFLRQCLRLIHWINVWVLRKKADHRQLVKIRSNFESTVRFLHRGWLQLIVVGFWVCMDWTLTALALFYCFQAVGVDLPPGLLLVGFSVMFLTSIINPVPAGLGVSETLLAGIFSYLGVGFEKSLVAALLFRFVFFLLPLAVSTALYMDTLRSFLKSSAKEKTL